MDNVLGIKEMKIDEKGRVNLPADFGINPGEKLILLLNKDYIEVQDIRIVLETLIELKERIKTISNIEMYNFYQNQINSITACSLNKVEVDNQSRINIGTTIKKDYYLTNKVILEGTLDGFRIWNVDKFKEYQDSFINKGSRK